jgi:hypothetical protein
MRVKVAATLKTCTNVVATVIGPVNVRAVSVGATASKSLIETLCTFKSHRLVFPIPCFLLRNLCTEKALMELKATDIKIYR